MQVSQGVQVADADVDTGPVHEGEEHARGQRNRGQLLLLHCRSNLQQKQSCAVATLQQYSLEISSSTQPLRNRMRAGKTNDRDDDDDDDDADDDDDDDDDAKRQDECIWRSRRAAPAAPAPRPT